MNDINWMQEVENRKEELLQDLFDLLAIDSVRDDSQASPEAPVGPGPKKALEKFLELGRRDGFEVENFDNYAGHILYGEGEEDLGILMHVDVVPIDDGWETDPFKPEIIDGKIYARGASDDKGPGMAAYYALKIVRDLDLPLSKQIRFIIGTDEESDWQCMDHYFNKNPKPTLAFSPDANFPIINGEKGMVTYTLDYPASVDSKLISFSSGQRENMVPQKAEAQVKTDQPKDLVVAYQAYLKDVPVTGEVKAHDGQVSLVLHGQASHGAKPEEGINAGTYLAVFLNDYLKESEDFLKDISHYIHLQAFAEKLGLQFTDEVMGDLTMNAGVMTYQADKGGQVLLNFRFPKGMTAEEIEKNLSEKLSSSVKLTKGQVKTPHYVPADDPLVDTLLAVYERQTGLEGHEQVIGGGTYGRLVERGVAYGAMFPGTPDTMHQSNEFIPLDDLLQATAIYAEAIYQLCQ